MQESSCDPSTVGGAGEQGLMQLTKDKCGSAPDGNCKDPVSVLGVHHDIRVTQTWFYLGLQHQDWGLVLLSNPRGQWRGSLVVYRRVQWVRVHSLNPCYGLRR